MPDRKKGPPVLLILPPDKGRKSSHLAVTSHRGGGWYDVACMGEAKACREGRCKHTAGMQTMPNGRRLRQVARVSGSGRVEEESE